MPGVLVCSSCAISPSPASRRDATPLLVRLDRATRTAAQLEGYAELALELRLLCHGPGRGSAAGPLDVPGRLYARWSAGATLRRPSNGVPSCSWPPRSAPTSSATNGGDGPCASRSLGVPVPRLDTHAVPERESGPGEGAASPVLGTRAPWFRVAPFDHELISVTHCGRRNNLEVGILACVHRARIKQNVLVDGGKAVGVGGALPQREIGSYSERAPDRRARGLSGERRRLRHKLPPLAA